MFKKKLRADECLLKDCFPAMEGESLRGSKLQVEQVWSVEIEII